MSVNDPSLILDRRAEMTGPGLHAIFIGISDYQFLAEADGPPGEGLAALQKREGCARTAYEVMSPSIPDARLCQNHDCGSFASTDPLGASAGLHGKGRTKRGLR